MDFPHHPQNNPQFHENIDRMNIELWLNAGKFLIPIYRCFYQLQIFFNLK